MADQGDRVLQVPAGENLQPAQAVAVAQPPPPLLLQNQEEPADPNPRQNAAAGEDTGLFSVLFSRFQHVLFHIVSPLRF